MFIEHLVRSRHGFMPWNSASARRQAKFPILMELIVQEGMETWPVDSWNLWHVRGGQAKQRQVRPQGSRTILNRVVGRVSPRRHSKARPEPCRLQACMQLIQRLLPQHLLEPNTAEVLRIQWRTRRSLCLMELRPIERDSSWYRCRNRGLVAVFSPQGWP